jgi:hypothetical protein
VKSFLNKKLLIGATGLVLLGGGAGALAATQTSGGSGAQAYVNDVARHLNIAPSALTAAIKAADVDRINAAVVAGRLTQAQATALKQRIQQTNGVPFFGRRFGRGGFGGRSAVAAQYLGISRATLRSELQSGKTLAQIASSTPGKSVAGLKAAIIAAATTRLDKAVSAGLISSQQEQHRVTNLSTCIDALIQRTWAGGPDGGQGLGYLR